MSVSECVSAARPKVAILGHTGMVGQALSRRLAREDAEVLGASSHDVDLCNMQDVDRWFEAHRPQQVYVAAARVGGISENVQHPVEFLEDNALIAVHVTRSAHKYGVEKLVYIGSSCMYPARCEQPMQEEMILSGPFEPTNEGYAIGKLIGMKLCEYYRRQFGANFIAVLPCNLYGPGDNWTESGHVMASLVRKIVGAKEQGHAEVELWGTGSPRREFLHVDDCADACVLAMAKYENQKPLNVGSGSDVTIKELASLIASAAEYSGAFVFDTSKPDGMARKLLDTRQLDGLEWKQTVSLTKGIREMINDYLSSR